MTASLSGVFNAQQFTDAGLPAASHRLYTYAPGTTTQKVAYTDAAASIPHTYTSDGIGGLYIALNARGELPASLFLTAGGYDLALKTPAGVTVWTRRASGTDDTGSGFATSLAAASGANLVGFSPTTAYTSGIGQWLNIRGARSPAELAASVTPTLYQFDEGDIRRYGAVLDGVTSDSAALDKLYLVLSNGGHGYIPARQMMLTTQSTLAIENSGTASRYANLMLEGYGCEILTTNAIAALDVRYGFTPMNVAIKGFKINHRGNATALAGVRLRQAVNVTLEDIAIEGNNNAAAYGGFMLLQDVASDNNTANFWTTIRGCSLRKRSGGDTGTMPAGIILEGGQNATLIEDCNIGGSGIGLVIRPPAGQSFMPNSVVVQNNAFEGLTRAIQCTTALAGAAGARAWDTGTKIIHNRFEALSLGMYKWAAGEGVSVADPSHPMISRDNYGNAGSVGTYNDMSAGFGLRMYTQDQSYFGPETAFLQGSIAGPEFDMASGSAKISNFSGNSAWNGAHLVMGIYHLWVDNGTGKLYIKSSAPISATDGTVVGTQT